MAYHCHSLLRDVLQRCWSCCRTSSSSAVRCLSIPLGPLPLLLSLRRGTGTLCCRGRRTGRPGCGSCTLVSAPWAGEDAAAVPQRCGAAAPPGGWLLARVPACQYVFAVPARVLYGTAQKPSQLSWLGFSSTHSFRTCKTQSVPRNHALCQKFGSGPVHVCVAFRWDRTKLVPVQTLACQGMRVGKWNRMWWIPLHGSPTCLPHMHWAHRYRYRLWCTVRIGVRLGGVSLAR